MGHIRMGCRGHGTDAAYLVDNFTSYEILCGRKYFFGHNAALAIRHIDSLNCNVHCLWGEERIIPYLIFSPTLTTHT